MLFAAVVVERDVVQPRGVLGVLLAGRQQRHIGEAARGGQRGEDGGIVEAVVGDDAFIKGLPEGVAVGGGGLVKVGVFVPLVFDDVGGVVDDDVQVDPHAAGMGLADGTRGIPRSCRGAGRR